MSKLMVYHYIVKQATKALLRELLTRPGIGNEKERVHAFFGKTSVAVVSRTFTSSRKQCRKILPHHFFIILLIGLQVIDTTDSISDGISSVRAKIAARIIDNPNTTSVEPLYIVTGFDSSSYNLAALDSDVTQFQSAVNSLNADEGGDCAEMSGGGTLLAVQNSLPNGNVWVFTDASAKDSHLYHVIAHNAKMMNVKINYGLTGSCSHIDPVST
jgi:hypothetical protein